MNQEWYSSIWWPTDHLARQLQQEHVLRRALVVPNGTASKTGHRCVGHPGVTVSASALGSFAKLHAPQQVGCYFHK